MMKTIRELLLVSLIALVGVVFVSQAPAALAQDKDDVCKGVQAAGGTCTDNGDINKFITNAINVLSYVIGIVGVVMVMWAGFKYITAGGDAGSISSAKTTMIYAIVGLVIAAMAQVIVGFVLDKTP